LEVEATLTIKFNENFISKIFGFDLRAHEIKSPKRASQGINKGNNETREVFDEEIFLKLAIN